LFFIIPEVLLSYIGLKRGPRAAAIASLYAALGATTALIGRALSRWLSDRQLLWVLIGAWLLFYAVFFALMPN
jgi:hypothetical protein